MENQETKPIELSESAFRELKPDEKYEPVMSPDKNYPEVNAWSVTWGVLMAVLFSAAAAYLGLKVGQVFEAAIPIAIIAIGLSSAAKRKNALGENVIIQSIGACSGAIVAGGIFVMPAIYMLALHADFLRIFIAAALGGVLGIPDSFPQVFRQGHARKVSLPRGNGYDPGARLGREGRQPSQTVVAGRHHRRTL